jgi:hypothetical protein
LCLFAIGALSAATYAIPLWWLEFSDVGAQKIVSSFVPHALFFSWTKVM